MLWEDGKQAEDSQEVELERNPLAVKVAVADSSIKSGINAEVAIGHNILSH